MKSITCVGIAVHDFVFTMEALPHRAGKHYATGFTEVGGGIAANAAVAAARLGASVRLISRVGDDTVGARVVADLATEGVDVSGVSRIVGTHTPVSAVLIDAAGERLIVNHTSAALFEVEPAPAETDPGDCDVVLVDTRWPAAAAATLRTHSGIGVVDYDHDLPGARALASSATHVVFGSHALASYAGTEGAQAGILKAAAETGAWCAVTLGGNGVWWTDRGEPRHQPAFPVDPVDTLGAGDVFHGAFAVALAEGEDEVAALRFASAAAALKCTRPGGRAGTPTRTEVDRFLEEYR